MQVSTGNIAPLEEVLDYGSLQEMKKQELIDELRDNGGYVPLDNEDVSRVKRMAKPVRKNWMRNQPCLCGSSKKFKKCCWHRYA